MKLATEFSYRFWQVLQYPPISSRDTTIRKWQSVLTCRLELFAEKNLGQRPGSSVTPQAEATSWPPPPRRRPAPRAAGASLGVLKCTAVSVVATALAPTTNPITRNRSSPGPFPGPGAVLLPNFGLNGNSNGLLFGFTVSYEIEQFLIPKESGTPNSEKACLMIAMRAGWRNLSPRRRPLLRPSPPPRHQTSAIIVRPPNGGRHFIQGSPDPATQARC